MGKGQNVGEWIRVKERGGKGIVEKGLCTLLPANVFESNEMVFFTNSRVSLYDIMLFVTLVSQGKLRFGELGILVEICVDI